MSAGYEIHGIQRMDNEWCLVLNRQLKSGRLDFIPLDAVQLAVLAANATEALVRSYGVAWNTCGTERPEKMLP